MAHAQKSLGVAQRSSSISGGTVHSQPQRPETVRMLNARAKLPDNPIGRERRTMVRFDAWTDPRILRTLKEDWKSLSKEARELFCDQRPEIDPTELRCAFELITRVPLDRARKLAAGMSYGVKVRVEGQAKLLLDAAKDSLLGRNAPAKPPERVLLPALIKRMANYLHTIFRRHLSTRNTPIKELEGLFARFASGALRIEVRGPQEWMNAEPDSAFFFAFAEFCIQAAHFNANPGRRWWISLGGLFAALQDVYCLRYHKDGGERRFTDYRDVFFNDKRRISEKTLLKHVQSVRKRCGTIGKLVEHVTWNAFWYFFDDVQPLTENPLPAPPPARPPRRSSRNGSSISRT